MQTSQRSPALSALTTVVLVVIPASLLALALYVRPQMLGLVTNSDALLPADLVWEFLNHPETWRSFQWPRIPSVMPDLLMFASLQAGFGWRWAQLGYSALSLAAITGLAGMIAPQLAAVSIRAGALMFLAVTSVVLVAEWGLSTTAWHLHLFAAAYHSGPFILSVAALALAWRGGVVALTVMVLLAASGTFSDRMVVGTFLLPLAAALGVLVWQRRFDRRSALRRVLLAVLGCAIGLAADKLIFPQFLTRQADVPLAPLAMVIHALGFLGSRSAWYVVTLNASVLIPLWRTRGPGQAGFWWLAAAAAMVPSSLLTAGLWEDDGGQRYLSAALWWPIILWAPTLAQRAGRYAVAGALAVTLAGITAFAIPAVSLKTHPLLAWHDGIAACLAPTGRTAGLAEYWLARRVTVASDWRLQVMQVGPRGNTRIWGNDPAWYTISREQPAQKPPFSFIIMSGLDEAAIRAAYGPADQILPCPGSDVWLYNDPAHVREALAAASPSLVPRGQSVCVGPDRLSRRGGPLPAGPMRVTSDRQTSRPVTFGPNLDLHAGRWRVSLRYTLQSDRPGDDTWLVNGQWGTLHLARTPLPPTGAEPRLSEADVTLNREIEAVEVPTFLAGNATLDIRQACFTPLD